MARWRLGDGAGGSLLFGSAVRLLPDDLPLRDEIACERGVALTTLGQYDAARDAFAVARGSAERRIALRAELEDTTIDALRDGSAAGRMLELAERAIPVFDAAGDLRALGRAWFLLAWLRGGALGQWAESEQAAERALAYYREIGYPPSTCFGAIATAVCLGPTPVRDAAARCIELLEGNADQLTAEAVIAPPLAYLHAMAGDFEVAHATLERGETIFSDLGRLGSIRLSVWPTEARVLRLAGALEEAATAYIRNCEALREVRGGFHLVTQASELVGVLDELGRYEEAGAWADVAEQNARDFDREGSALALAARALVNARLGDLTAALEAGRAALGLAERTDAPATRAAAYLALAAGEGDGSGAAYVAAALGEYERKGNVAAAARIRARAAATNMDTVS
jgi:tetratricopeptide (TPR) repeat protein